jgi:hypothetical protein
VACLEPAPSRRASTSFFESIGSLDDLPTHSSPSIFHFPSPHLFVSLTRNIIAVSQKALAWSAANQKWCLRFNPRRASLGGERTVEAGGCKWLFAWALYLTCMTSCCCVKRRCRAKVGLWWYLKKRVQKMVSGREHYGRAGDVVTSYLRLCMVSLAALVLYEGIEYRYHDAGLRRCTPWSRSMCPCDLAARYKRLTFRDKRCV